VRKNVHLLGKFHVGPGSILWAPRHLTVGVNTYVGKNVTIQVDGVIGDGVLIANNVGIIGRTDHDATQIGASIRDSRWVGDHPTDLSRPVTIGSDVWIGFGAIVLSGIRIGDSSIVAAGSLVTADVPENVIVAGSPARVMRRRFGDDDYVQHWRLLSEQGYLKTAPDAP
jgi:acetyltransferase-like isoleucine patch superfamily enzyme